MAVLRLHQVAQDTLTPSRFPIPEVEEMGEEILDTHDKPDPGLSQWVHPSLVVCLELQVEDLMDHGKVVLVTLPSADQLVQLVYTISLR